LYISEQGELLNSNSKGNEELHLKEEAINQAEALLKKLTKEVYNNAVRGNCH
jgi:hypothetical protein